MIELKINLPERYRLVSIQNMWNERWAVCVCIAQPGEKLGSAYGLAEDPDVAEAARRAIEVCERKAEAEAFLREQQAAAAQAAEDVLKGLGL